MQLGRFARQLRDLGRLVHRAVLSRGESRHQMMLRYRSVTWMLFHIVKCSFDSQVVTKPRHSTSFHTQERIKTNLLDLTSEQDLLVRN